MSVDLVATLPRPITLDVLVAAARETMADLLGMAAAPTLAVFAERRYRQGRRVDAGRQLGASALAGQMVGEPIPGPWAERPSTCPFEFEVDGTGEGARLMVVDYCEVPGIDDLDDPGESVQAVFSPYRTCMGVVTAASLALAAARCSGGEFVDSEIRMLEPPMADPARFIAVTRLAGGGDVGFGPRCEAYLRQFAKLGGWPRNVTVAG